MISFPSFRAPGDRAQRDRMPMEVTPRPSELRTHSQTVPYLHHEPVTRITQEGKKRQFLEHCFPPNNVTVKRNLDLSDIRYDPSDPRKAERILAERLNSFILPSSKNQFIQWPLHSPPSGFTHDRRLDIAVIDRSISPNVHQSSSDHPICPDVTDVQSCIEHTVISGSPGRRHNGEHAFAKINDLLKCPLNLSIIVLGLHGSSATLWYADRCGIIEVDLGNDKSLCHQAVLGLSNTSAFRDPCVAVHRLTPHRIYKFALRNDVFYGVHGSRGEALCVGDGIACRGTLVLPGVPEAETFLGDHDAGFSKTQVSKLVAIKLSHPSLPWTTEFSYQPEWQVLQLLNACGVRNVPKLINHHEQEYSTKVVREAGGLHDKRHRLRTILVTQPLAECTLHDVIQRGMELPKIVQVMKDIIDAHEDAWRKARLAHCDISPANIQIPNGRAILADWEFGTPVDQLATDRAINSGTLDTMPPRLALHRLEPSSFESSSVSRTVWDEMCSIFLCFMSVLGPMDMTQEHGRMGLVGRLHTRMTKLSMGNKMVLRPQYQSDPTVGAMRSAVAKLFVNEKWMTPPPDADSLDWWDKLRGILDLFIADSSFV